MSMKLLAAGLGFASVLGAAAAAQAGPVTYTQTVNNVSLRLPAPIGTLNNVTVTLVAQADTTNIFNTGNVFAQNGKCVLATSATFTVTGVPTQTISSPVHVCAQNNGATAGFYTGAGGVDIMMGSQDAYVIDLDQNTTSNYMANNVRPGVGRPTLAVSAELPGGGDVIFNHVFATNQTFPNTTASTFVTALAGGPPPPAPVPTLSEWAMILLGTILAGAAALQLSRRRGEA